MAKMLGIVFANYDTPNLDTLTRERTISALPFAGRFRLIDFPLSNMVNSGIISVGLVTPYKYRSIVDHVGSGKEWGLDRKNGGLFLCPGSMFGVTERTSRFLLRDLRKNRALLDRSDADYAVITSANFVNNIDYKDMLNCHINSNKDVTMAYDKKNNFIDCFITSRQILLDLCTGYREIDFFDIIDIFNNSTDKFSENRYEYNGFSASIFSIDDYFKENLELLNNENFNQLFSGHHKIITKVRNTAPSNYHEGCCVKNCLIPSGCEIEGTVENSILFRDVNIRYGAVVKNSIIMQSCTICEGAVVENAILDRGNIISANCTIRGTTEQPFVIGKNEKKA